MPKLPVVSGKQTIKKLQKSGYSIYRQKGSHVRMLSADSACKPVSVPLHDTLKPGLLNQIIKDANLTVEEFTAL